MSSKLYGERTQGRGLQPLVAGALVFCLLLVSHRLQCEGKASSRESSIHTVVTTECTPYFDWQVLGLWYRQACLVDLLKVPQISFACLKLCIETTQAISVLIRLLTCHLPEA